MNRNRFWTLSFGKRDAPEAVASTPTEQRLAQGFACLQNLQKAREELEDPHFGTGTEQRIVWRELLELELQDVDEQIERILNAAGSP